LYAENGGDLSTDFLLFNELFKTSTEKEVKLSSYSELTKLTNITNLVRPDPYSLATNKLNVNFEKESSSKEDKKYMFFKTALSLQRYESQLKW
jgi:hypothetical protein